jgi:hypothetical protein
VPTAAVLLLAPHVLAVCVTHATTLLWRCRWWQKDKPQPTPEDFHKHAVKEMDAWRNCLLKESYHGCVRGYRPQQLVKGMYGEFLPVSGAAATAAAAATASATAAAGQGIVLRVPAL